jgi:hypothetical protein
VYVIAVEVVVVVVVRERVSVCKGGRCAWRSGQSTLRQLQFPRSLLHEIEHTTRRAVTCGLPVLSKPTLACLGKGEATGSILCCLCSRAVQRIDQAVPSGSKVDQPQRNMSALPLLSRLDAAVGTLAENTALVSQSACQIRW